MEKVRGESFEGLGEGEEQCEIPQGERGRCEGDWKD